MNTSKLLFFFLFQILFSHLFSQTTGLIILPADATGKLVLDPNNDGYTSSSTAGFLGNDQLNTEIPFQTLIPAGNEPNSDLGPGPDCGYTDFVESLYGGIDPVFHYSTGTEWLFRFRMAGVAPNAKSYSVLIDTDGLFGPDDVGTYTSTNPGFEIEIVLATKFGVRIYNHDQPCGSNLVASYGPGRIQKSIAASTECSSMNYFLDCYVDWADITAQFGVDENSFMRYALVDNMAADKSSICNPSSISDLGAVDDNACGSLEACFTEVINNQPPCQPSSTTTCVYSDCPEITGLPLPLGTTSISGTSSEPDGTTINIYVNGIFQGSSNVLSGTWTVAAIPALQANDLVEATAQSLNEIESGTNCNNSTVAGIECTDPVLSISQCNANKAFEGYCSAVGAVINLYDANGNLISPTSGTVWDATTSTISTTTTPSSLSDPNNNFLWRCVGAGATTSCTAGGGPCLIDGNYYITATLPGQCESEPFWFCIGLSNSTSDPIISSTLTTSSTSINGSLVGNLAENNGVDIFLYINGNIQSTTTTSNNNGDWSITGLSFNQCDEVKVIAVNNTANASCPSNEVIQIIAGPNTAAPIILGDYCTSSSITQVSGSSSGSDGTIIQLFENGNPVGPTVTVSNGTWEINTGINILAGSTITATALDTSGCESVSIPSSGVFVENQSTNSVTIDPVVIIEGTTSISGTGTDGDIITLYIDGYPIFEDLAETTIANTIVSGGTWAISTIYSEAIFANATITATSTTGALCNSQEFDPTPTICASPNTSTTFNPDTIAVCVDSTIATIEIINSEVGVIYQLFNISSGNNTGSSTLGNGDTINLSTNYIITNSTIKVLAIKFPYDGSCTELLDDSLIVLVNNFPDNSLLLSGDSTICENTSANISVFNSEIGVSYQLRDNLNNNIGNAINGTGGTINLSTENLSSSTIFNVLAIGGAPSNCSIQLIDTVNITVTANPSSPTVTNSTPICENDTIFLNASFIANAAYSWTGPDSYISNDNNPVIINANLNDTGYYSVTVTVNGCISLPDSTLVTVTENPFAGNISGLSTLCDGDTGTLSSNGDLNGEWYSQNSSVATIDINTGFISAISGGSTSILYIVLGSNGCVNDTSSFNLTVNNCNLTPIANDDSTNTNEDTSVTFNVTNNDTDNDGIIDPSTVDLDPSSPGIQSSISTTDGNWSVDLNGNVTFNPSSNFNGTSVITYTVNDNDSSSSNIGNIIVNVNPINDPPIIDNEYLITSLNTSISGDLTDTGDSDVDGNLIVNTSPLFGPYNGNISINPDGTFNYIPNNGFAGFDTVIVEICDDGTPLPALCVNDTIFITVNNCDVSVLNADCDGDGVTNGTESNDGTDPFDPCSFILANQDTSPSATWLATDCDGDGVTNGTEITDGTDPLDPCSLDVNSITLTITTNERCGLNIPDGFSPNNDGVNDYFVIRGIENYPNNSFSVLNRWGNKVYESKGYTNDWDGTNQFGISLGNILPVGTYFYILDLGEEGDSGNQVFKGYIYLNR